MDESVNSNLEYHLKVFDMVIHSPAALVAELGGTALGLAGGFHLEHSNPGWSLFLKVIGASFSNLLSRNLSYQLTDTDAVFQEYEHLK